MFVCLFVYLWANNLWQWLRIVNSEICFDSWICPVNNNCFQDSIYGFKFNLNKQICRCLLVKGDCNLLQITFGGDCIKLFFFSPRGYIFPNEVRVPWMIHYKQLDWNISFFVFNNEFAAYKRLSGNRNNLSLLSIVATARPIVDIDYVRMQGKIKAKLSNRISIVSDVYLYLHNTFIRSLDYFEIQFA